MQTATLIIIAVGETLFWVTLIWMLFNTKWKGTCSDCGEELATFRKPQTLKQALWGGWTCPECNSEFDRTGHKITVHS